MASFFECEPQDVISELEATWYADKDHKENISGDVNNTGEPTEYIYSVTAVVSLKIFGEGVYMGGGGDYST
jgi:hypothetical protein